MPIQIAARTSATSTPTTPTSSGTFARVVHRELPYAQSLIDGFSVAPKEPHITISIDMLDTGIDVPPACANN